jgi:hypothetical protein
VRIIFDRHQEQRDRFHRLWSNGNNTMDGNAWKH